MAATLALLPIAAPTFAQTPDRPIDPDRAAELFEEARGLEAGNPWAVPLFGPLLFVDPSTRYVVATEGDTNGVLHPEGSVFAGLLPEDVGIANTAVEWGGKRWTMVMWPPPAGYFARRVLIAHELFHRLAPELGLRMTSPTNDHLDSAEGRIWFRLELRALARALAAEGADRREAVLDALRFRARRHEVFPSAAEEERALELNEGLAEYTGVHAALPSLGRAGWAARLVESQEVRAAEAGITRNFAYATGPAYGLLLGALWPEWENEVDEDFDLAEATARAYAAPPARALAASAPAHMDAYDGIALTGFEQKRAAAREQQLAAWRKRFFEEPVLRLPADSAFGYSFNPNALATIEGLGQVLIGGSVRGGWGSLESSSDVLLRRVEGLVVEAIVPAPTDPEARPISGDGWVLDLRESWKLTPGERPGDWTVRPSGP